MKGIAILMVFTISFLFSINANAYALLLSDDPVGDTDLVVVGTIVTANPKFDSQNYHVPETEYVAYIEEMNKQIVEERQMKLMNNSSFLLQDPMFISCSNY